MSQELVVMVGLQGSGKSTWVREHLAGHAVVSKDHWPNARRREARQRRVVAELLAAGHSVVVDNTNPGFEERASLIGAARAAGCPVRAVFVDTPVDACLARNAARAGRGRVPDVGVFATLGRLVPPTVDEGFDRVDVVRPPEPRPHVTAVSRAPGHTFSKTKEAGITLVPGEGVAGDAHAGPTVRHRSRVARTPHAPNLRQVHLLAGELHDELRAGGFEVSPGDIGENVTTRGVDLLGLPTGTRLRLGDAAVVEVTGLRNPCRQLDRFQAGLMRAVLDRDDQGNLVRKAGVMGIVVAGGEVRPGDPITVQTPPPPHTPLAPV